MNADVKVLIDKVVGCGVELSDSACVDDIVNCRKVVTFVNPMTLKLLGDCASYMPVLSRFDYVFVDGILLSKWVGTKVNSSVPRRSFDGNSLAPILFRMLKNKGLKCAFVGAKRGVASQAAAFINQKHDGIVQFSRDGYFSNVGELVSELDGVDAVVLGLGAPKQDEVALELKRLLPNLIVVTCGGYLDQIVMAKEESFYPDWINRLNLRSIYRIYREPLRMLRRYAVDYFPFYREVLLSWVSK